MKNILLGMFSLLFMQSLSAQKINLSGNWGVVIPKSDTGQILQSLPSLIQINQQKDSIIISRTFNGQVNTERLSLDGKPFISSIPPRVVSKSSRATWAADGTSLSVIQHYDMKEENGMTWVYDRTEKYSFADNGSKLMLERISVLPDRTETISAVYDNSAKTSTK